MLRMLLIALAALSLGGCIDSQAPLAEERRLLLSAADFAAYQAPAEGRYGKLVSYAERSIELSFESAGSDWFYLYSDVSLYPRASDALLSRYAESFGASFGLHDSGLAEQELELDVALASHASLKLLTQDGEPVGNLFYATIGNKSLFTVFTGVYFDRAADFEAFIAPKLAALRVYRHDDPLLAWAGRTLGFSD